MNQTQPSTRDQRFKLNGTWINTQIATEERSECTKRMFVKRGMRTAHALGRQLKM